MTARRQRLGAVGEDRVARRYESHGFTVLERNWRVRAGEIDLIVAKGPTLVICEVKTRSSTRFGSGAEAVGHDKQRRLRKLAIAYLAAQDHYWPDLRFDVAWVSPTGVRVYEAAF